MRSGYVAGLGAMAITKPTGVTPTRTSGPRRNSSIFGSSYGPQSCGLTDRRSYAASPRLAQSTIAPSEIGGAMKDPASSAERAGAKGGRPLVGPLGMRKVEMTLFRGGAGAIDAAAAVTRPGDDRRTSGRGRAALLLAGIWLLGLVALGAVIEFERRVDSARQAQVVIAEMHNQQSDLLEIAFAPATAAKPSADSRLQTTVQLTAAKAVMNGSVAKLVAFGHSSAPATIAALDGRYFKFIDGVSALVAAGASQKAAIELGTSEQPGGIEYSLTVALTQAGSAYGADADTSRKVSTVGTVGAILFLLIGFSVAFGQSVRARRRSHREASTDALTGLGNRRKLFADLEPAVASLARKKTITIGIFDLDGFKAYNDTFGHPAGDALLARLGSRLTASVAGNGNAYRIGGDEFVVATAATDPQQLLAAGQTALTETGEGFSIGCSIGSTDVRAGVTLDQALHVADQRLYANKRTVRSECRSEVTDALLQVLAEQNQSLVTHLGHVAALAQATARTLGLPAEQVTLTRLAAELHDIGKSAIPASILDKPGPLDPAERAFMQRHSVIGERIVAAAPTLEAIAPIVRAAHERPDGGGYPDGLHLDEIPICSRIIAVVDAYDAMTNNRPYRQAIPTTEALAELRLHAGTQFDPGVVEAFVTVLANHAEAALAA
jgi:diguanylate cyclase (GGDEF)-like protein/putative nucleotidyltransferase with HDIG domain